MNKILKIRLVIFCIILIFSNLFFLGCTEPTDVTPDTSLLFSLTDSQLHTSIKHAFHYLNNHMNTSGYFVEIYDAFNNISVINPELLLQLQLHVLLLSRTNTTGNQQHTPVFLQTIQNTVFQNDTTTLKPSFINQSDERLLTTVLLYLFQSSNITTTDNSIVTLSKIVSDRVFMQDNQSSTSTDSINTLINDCISLSTIISINTYLSKPLFPQEKIEEHYHYIAKHYDDSTTTSNDYIVFPWFTDLLYQLYTYTEKNIYATIHVNLTTEFITYLEDQNNVYPNLVYQDQNNTISYTTASNIALYSKPIAQAYHLAKTLNKPSMENQFIDPLFQGIYRIYQLQEKNTENISSYGGLYTNTSEKAIYGDTMLYSIQALLFTQECFTEQQWTYLYDGSQGYLTVSSQMETNIFLWYLLSAGVIISIIFLVILYAALRILHQRKNR